MSCCDEDDDVGSEFKYTEIFSSFQGEGTYTGTPSVWVRFWGCNLSCPGFGQKEIDNPDSWERPWEDLDFKQYTKIEDIPVFEVSCDSGYSWSKKVRHLAKKATASEIADMLTDCLRSPSNPNGLFLHPKSMQYTHLVFTGGEPMMSQNAMMEIVKEFLKRKNVPLYITVETNGTKPPKDEFCEFVYKLKMCEHHGGLAPDDLGPIEWFWSVSPKLRSSGEPWSKAIQPEVLSQYSEISDMGHIKFVVNNDELTWFEVDKALALFRGKDVYWPCWIMPVGATKESQMSDETAAIAREAIARGYQVSVRSHCYVFGNTVGS